MCTGVVSVVSVVLRRVEQENEHVAAETTALDGREGEAKGDATLRHLCRRLMEEDIRAIRNE